EECDDGNEEDGDGCDALCRVERCRPDVVLGTLPTGVTVTRTVDLATEADDVGACGAGNDVVLSFAIALEGDLELEILQLGDHRYGLYRADESGSCTGTLARCWDPGGASSGRTVFTASAPGEYLLIAEEDRAGAGGPASVALTLLAEVPPECGD